MLDGKSEAAADDEMMLLNATGEAAKAATSIEEEGAVEDEATIEYERLGLGSGKLETCAEDDVTRAATELDTPALDDWTRSELLNCISTEELTLAGAALEEIDAEGVALIMEELATKASGAANPEAEEAADENEVDPAVLETTWLEIMLAGALAESDGLDTAVEDD